MTTFRYKGISSDGANVHGVVNAYDEFEAVAKLRESCSIITKIEAVQEAKAPSKRLKIKTKELALLCSQFSIILRAGIPVVGCVTMVAAQAKNQELRHRLEKVAEDVDAGATLAQAFENNLSGLPTTFTETIRAGEQSGTLETCFSRLHQFFDKSAKVRAKVVAALTYPAIVLVVAVIVIMIIMIFAVPMFVDTFQSMGTDLPLPTRILIGLSNFFTNYWWVVIMLGLSLWGGYLALRKTPNGRRMLSEFSLKKSPLHTITAMNCAAQFSSTMATMIAAGLPITKALEVTAGVVNNYVFSLAVDSLRQSVEQGHTVADSMRENDVFPKLLAEMTSVGERSGAMEETLDVVGDYFNNEVMIASERLLSLLEPAITITLAVLTVLLLLAVYLPMFSMYGGIAE